MLDPEPEGNISNFKPMFTPEKLRQVFWISLTFLSKGAGFLREFLLLAMIGLGRGLDNFLFFLNTPVIMVTVVSAVIYTITTPQIARANEQDFESTIARMAADSIRLGISLTIVALATNLAFAFILNDGSNRSQLISLAAICSISVFFSVTAEYCSAWLTVRRNIGQLVIGNVAISVPPILTLLVTDIGITTYAAVFASSFALRTIWLLFCLRRDLCHIRLRRSDFRGRLLVWKHGWKSLAGGSPIIAMQALMILPILISRGLPESSVSLYFYTLKIPQLYFSTIWFVITTYFFSSIQTKDKMRVRKSINQLFALNFCIAVLVGVALGFGYLSLIHGYLPESLVTRFALRDLLPLWLLSTPLLFLFPWIDMLQKTFSRFDTLVCSGRMAVFQVVVAIPLLLLGFSYGTVSALLLSVIAALMISAVYGLVILRKEVILEEVSQP